LSWKGVKCENCGRDIGCPHCGQVLPDLKVISEKVGNLGYTYFCSSKCRDEYKQKMKG